MKSCLIGALSLLSATIGSSAAVVQDTVSVGQPLPAYPYFDDQWVSHDLAGAFYANNLTTTTFEVSAYFVGLGFSYYVVEEGAPITWYSLYPASALITNTYDTRGNQFTIPDGGSVLLGFWFDEDESFSMTSTDDYGWVRVQNQGGVISSLGSAVAEDGPGIVAGTLTTIPEPSLSVLGAFGFLALLRRRRAGV